MKELFRQNAQPILIYMGIETNLDPFEQNVEVSYLNPLPIFGIVSDLTATQSSWKMAGIITEAAKEIVIESKYKTLIEQSQKIQIVGEDTLYDGWRVNGKLQIRVDGDYLRMYIYSKTDSE